MAKMKNFLVTTISGSHIILEGLTSISRKGDAEKGQFEIRPTHYTLRVKCPQGKVLNVDTSKDLADLLELAFDQMAIRSSTYLTDNATSEKEVHTLLGDGLERVEPTEKVSKVTFKGGKLELDYVELYATERKARQPKPLDVNAMTEEQARELMAKLMAKFGQTV